MFTAADPTPTRSLSVGSPASMGSRLQPRQRLLLCVHSASVGGAERMALTEAEYLKSSFELIISVPEGPLRSRFAAHGELAEGTASLPLWGDDALTWLKRCVRTLGDAGRLARLIRRRRVDLVLTASSVSAAAVLGARLAGVPVVVHARDVPKSRLARLVLKLEGMLAQTVIVITEGLRPYYATRHGAAVVWIPEGIDLPADPAAAAGGPSAGRDARPRLCLIGGIAPRKGQDIAVEALAQMRGHGLNAELELIGREVDGVFASEVRARAERLGVASRVRFVGEIVDIRPHLEVADVVIAPSRGEWTPLSLMEAMAHRRPVVAAKVGGVSDVIDDGVSGVLIPADDPARLAAAVADLLADPPAAERMASRGREAIERSFDVRVALRALEEEIRRLIVPVPAA